MSARNMSCVVVTRPGSKVLMSVMPILTRSTLSPEPLAGAANRPIHKSSMAGQRKCHKNESLFIGIQLLLAVVSPAGESLRRHLYESHRDSGAVPGHGVKGSGRKAGSGLEPGLSGASPLFRDGPWRPIRKQRGMSVYRSYRLQGGDYGSKGRGLSQAFRVKRRRPRHGRREKRVCGRGSYASCRKIPYCGFKKPYHKNKSRQ